VKINCGASSVNEVPQTMQRMTAAAEIILFDITSTSLCLKESRVLNYRLSVKTNLVDVRLRLKVE
jgi:hypothetical protein